MARGSGFRAWGGSLCKAHHCCMLALGLWNFSLLEAWFQAGTVECLSHRQEALGAITNASKKKKKAHKAPAPRLKHRAS